MCVSYKKSTYSQINSNNQSALIIFDYLINFGVEGWGLVVGCGVGVGLGSGRGLGESGEGLVGGKDNRISIYIKLHSVRSVVRVQFLLR